MRRLLDEDPAVALDVIKISLEKLSTLHESVIEDKKEAGKDYEMWVYDLARLHGAMTVLKTMKL